MQTKKLPQLITFSFILFISFTLNTCAPILDSLGGGDGESDNSLLLLLGAGGSDAGTEVSPEDAGSGETEAPVTVVDPLQAEAEAILGVSFDETFMCYHVGNEGYVGSPVVASKIQSCLLDVGNNKKQIKFHPVNIDSSASKWFKPWCVTPPSKEGLETGIHTLHSDDAVAKYVLNRCYGGYKASIPDPEPTPAPSPNPDPEPAPELDLPALQLASWFNPMNLNGAKVYPETNTFYITFDKDIACERDGADFLENSKKLAQLWKKDSNGTWNRVTTASARCWANTLIVHVAGSSWSFSGNKPEDLALNEIMLEPNTNYRILLSADIESTAWERNSNFQWEFINKKRKLGVFNSLGDISGEPDKWSGIEFQTTNAPCFSTYSDRWAAHIGMFNPMGCAYASISQPGNKVTRNGCAIFTGPDSSKGNEACSEQMFPDVQMKPGMYLGLNTCDDPILQSDDCMESWTEKCQKQLKIKSSCIVNAGQANEYARIYYNLDSALPKDCNGIQRPVSPFYYLNDIYASNLTAKQYYEKYRRAACDGEPDPVAIPDPEPTPDPSCKNTVAMQTDEGQWFETPKSSYVNARGRTVKIKGIHTFWQNEPLKLNINACEEGWYKLAVRAKNYGGKKPDFYGAYHLNITDLDSNREYGISIPASDERYYTRKTFVYLQKGQNTFQSLWTNDAYLEGVYDANIQIRAARIVPYDGVPPNLNSIRKAGRKFCQTNGRFFGKGRAIVAEVPNQEVKYCFEGLEAAEYKLIVVAKNDGPAPEGFSNFKIRVKMNDSDVGFVDVPVDSESYKRGKLNVNIYGAVNNLTLSWINDHPETDDAEARFELKAIRLKKIGPVSESQLAAYLKSGSILRIGSILIVSILLLGLALMMRRRHLAKS